MAKVDKEDRFKRIFLALIAIGFMASGINSMIRTYCLGQPITGHLVHICDVATQPLAYFAGAMVFLIGFVLLYLERIIGWVGGG